MGQKFWFSILVVNLFLAWPAFVQAQQSDAPKVQDNAVADLEQLRIAASSSFSDQEAVSHLLALAESQVAKLRLTTPAGDNSYQTYQQILSLQPNNEAALAGIEQIGVKYVELADRAAAKGDLQKTRHYVAKARLLAPEHPSVQSMMVLTEVTRPTTKETTPPPEILADFKALVEAPAVLAGEKARIEAATPASARLEDLIEDAEDLVFNPANYQGRQVAVAGPVVQLFWAYRLVAETGQNSIVIDVDELSRADRDMLDAAIDQAGFLGQVRAQIKGTIERRALATFELAATELALIEIDPSEGKVLSPSLDRNFDEVTPLVVPSFPGELLGNTNFNNNRTRSGDHGRESAANSGGGGSGGASGSSGSGGSGSASGGGNGSSGSGSSGDGGGSSSGNSGNGNSGGGGGDDGGGDDGGGDD